MPLNRHPLLLVEDNPVNALVLRHLVERLGYTCILADNGQAAWQLLQQQQVCAILTDCEMPIMDGYTLTRRIRESQALSLRSLPIVALSARPNDSLRARCKEAGMNACIAKPADAHELEHLLRSLLDDEAEEQRPNSAFEKAFPDPAVQAALLHAFVDTVASDLVSLDTDFASGSLAQFRKTSHRILGSFQMLSELDLANDLESWSRAASMPSQHEYTRIREQLDLCARKVAASVKGH